MSREEAIAIIRSGKTGNEILDLLDKVTAVASTGNEVEPDSDDL
jgi:hypothetical protein